MRRQRSAGRAMPAIAASLFLSLALSMAAGCDEEKPNPHAAMETLWQQIVGDVSLEKSKEAIGGGECKTGLVSGLHVDLCLYKDALSADAAREQGLKLVGSQTGAALVRGRFLLVIADRDKVDVHGKKLNQVAKLFLDMPES